MSDLDYKQTTIKADVPPGQHDLPHDGAVVQARHYGIPTSDMRYWIFAGVLVFFVAVALGLAIYAFYRWFDEKRSLDRLSVSQAFRLGGGNPITYLASGTATIVPAAQGNLPSTTPVTIPTAPTIPHVLLTIQQGATAYRGASVYAANIKADSFNIVADLVTRGQSVESTPVTVALDGTQASITTPFQVSWVAIA